MAIAFAVFGLIVPARAFDDPPAGSTIPSDPVFTAQLIDGTTLAGRIRQINPRGDFTLVPTEGGERVIPVGRLLKLSREGFAPSLTPEGSLILFPNGDRLFRSSIGAANETVLDVQSYTLGHLAIPVENILGLLLSPPTDADTLDALLARVRTEPRTTEVLWLANGDRWTGGFLGLDEKKIKFQADAGPIELERMGVFALGFDPALVVYPVPQGDYLDVTMADGSRLGVTGARIEQGIVIATTRFGATIRLSVAELVRVHARTASVVYLSERSVAAQQYVTYVGPTRPYRLDTTVEGHPLRLGGQAYDRGLGTQSRTLLAYKLAAGDRRFQALIGLDDRAGPLGSVVFRVLADGRERYASPPMSVRDTPRMVDVDVVGAKSLILVTEFGERGDVRDYADWVEARLIR